jgi:hypothetical protein
VSQSGDGRRGLDEYDIVSNNGKRKRRGGTTVTLVRVSTIMRRFDLRPQERSNIQTTRENLALEGRKALGAEEERARG